MYIVGLFALYCVLNCIELLSVFRLIGSSYEYVVIVQNNLFHYRSYLISVGTSRDLYYISRTKGLIV